MAGAAVPAEPGSGAVYERTVGTIGGGTIFLDADANGVQDSGERGGMSGVAVHLLGAAGERIATAETFAHACEGLYIFSGVLPGGNYTVEVVPPEGYGFTVPGMGGAPGETMSTVDTVNGTTTTIDLTEETVQTADLVVRDAGLVPAAA